MSIYDLQYSDVIYHFDRVRFISTYDVQSLQEFVPVRYLLENTNSDHIIKHHNGRKTSDGKPNWYKSKVDAVCCNDEFMEILDVCTEPKPSGKPKFVISKIEIAKDLTFDNFDNAYAYEQWFLKNVERKFTRKRWYNKGILYLGKSSADDDSKHYFRSYVCNSKVTGQPCYHSEFVIEGSDIIKKRIRNKFGVTKLTDAMDSYLTLEEKFLRYSM